MEYISTATNIVYKMHIHSWLKKPEHKDICRIMLLEYGPSIQESCYTKSSYTSFQTASAKRNLLLPKTMMSHKRETAWQQIYCCISLSVFGNMYLHIASAATACSTTEVRWCPNTSDFSILKLHLNNAAAKAVQSASYFLVTKVLMQHNPCILDFNLTPLLRDA